MENSKLTQCLKDQGSAQDCAACPLLKKEFCNEFIETIEKIRSDLKFNFTSIPEPGKETIVFKTVEAVTKNANNFGGRSRFSTWIWSIYKRKRIDYFRRKDKERETNISDFSSGEYSDFPFDRNAYDKWLKDKTDMRNKIVFVLKSKLGDDASGCIRLYLDLFYFAYELDRPEKDVAEIYGISQNTFAQKKKRCRKTVVESIGEC